MRFSRWVATVTCSVACGAWGQSYTWTDITPPDARIERVGVHPIDGRIIVTGYASTPAFAPLLRFSNDRGDTWNAPLTDPPYASSLFVHPGRPGVVFLEVAGFAGSVRFGTTSTRGELYRSDDFGRTWVPAYTTGYGESIKVFGADPLDAHGAYALRIPPQSCSAGLGCIYDFKWEIVQTHNDGLEWNTLSALPGRVTMYSWAYGPTLANPTRLFVGTFGSALVSGDGGATWLRFEAPLARPLGTVVPDPLRSNVLYGFQHWCCETDQINHNVSVRSDDGGASWRPISDSQFASQPPVVDPARSRTIWLGPEPDGLTSFVMRRSDDAGETWKAVPYPGGPYVYDFNDRYSRGNFFFQGLVPSPAEPGVAYVIQNHHVYRGVPSPRPQPVVVEFHYDIDRYWITSLDGEAVSQDYRKEPGNVWRTGLRWGAWNAEDAPAGAVGSCRFWPKPQTGWRTRILTLKDGECESIRSDPNWILEGEDEFFAVPSRDRATCPAGLVPVRRFHNLQPDFNHRWVADPALFAEMRVQRAWYDEGVRFCARPLGANE